MRIFERSRLLDSTQQQQFSDDDLQHERPHPSGIRAMTCAETQLLDSRSPSRDVGENWNGCAFVALRLWLRKVGQQIGLLDDGGLHRWDHG